MSLRTRHIVVAMGAILTACAQGNAPNYTPTGGGADGGASLDAGIAAGSGVCPAAGSCTLGDSCGGIGCTCFEPSAGGAPKCCLLGGHSGCNIADDCCNALGCDAGVCECIPTGLHCHFNNGCCSNVCTGGGSETANGTCQ